MLQNQADGGLARRPIERREYDILAGATRTPEFLSTINANGRIPTLQIGDRFLPESNAACIWLADGSRLIPDDRFDRADMLRWMFFEQYNHEPNIATLRFWLAFVGLDALSEVQIAAIPAKRAAGDAALAVMEKHLAAGERFFVGGALSLADICLYAYTHVAEEGSFDLTHYPAISAWIAAIGRTPGYIPITA
ncbi:glutathione S-transferase [Sphingomonas sp. KC8]|nr:glutathione S-transferase [Sphingomonas sp. KC8]